MNLKTIALVVFAIFSSSGGSPKSQDKEPVTATKIIADMVDTISVTAEKTKATRQEIKVLSPAIWEGIKELKRTNLILDKQSREMQVLTLNFKYKQRAIPVVLPLNTSGDSLIIKTQPKPVK